MTAEEAKRGLERLRELEDKKILPAETIRDLKRWWREKLSERRHGKIIEFPRGEVAHAAD